MDEENILRNRTYTLSWIQNYEKKEQELSQKIRVKVSQNSAGNEVMVMVSVRTKYSVWARPVEFNKPYLEFKKEFEEVFNATLEILNKEGKDTK